ncbi:MAG TPA: hypothetical protein VLF65_12810 [Burkholderiales bacterium]|jgi:hypothetical protein|nr:hypothetical protein [Burkholderiales bacterium]
MNELDASLTDRKMRAVVLIIGLSCIGAAGGTVLNQWPVFSLYPVLIAVAGGVMLALSAWAPVTVIRPICKVLSFGTWP